MRESVRKGECEGGRKSQSVSVQKEIMVGCSVSECE